MTSRRNNGYKNTLHALRGERLPKGHIFGMQTRIGEDAIKGVKIPLQYVQTENDPMQESRSRREKSEAHIVEAAHRWVRSDDRELIDPSQVAWPELS